MDGSRTGSPDAFENNGKFGCTVIRILEGNKKVSCNNNKVLSFVRDVSSVLCMEMSLVCV